jgi:hypothetical protein
MYLFHIFRSLIPLRNPLGFGASDLLTCGIVLLGLLAIVGHAWLADIFQTLSRRALWCMLGLFLLPIALRLALLPRVPAPVSTTAQESSSLLLADTLRHGRLSNPAHPLPQFFDSPLVVQAPSYRSILPLGDGLLPAAGWTGILLGIGALSALSYWMLRPWLAPEWAFCGGLLVACAFGPLCYWTNSYWGGFISALAGCLILGAWPRLRRAPRNFMLLIAGVTLELLSRPSWFVLTLPLLILAATFCLNRLKQFRPALLFAVLLICGFHFAFWYGMRAFADSSAWNAVRPYSGQDLLDSAAAQTRRALLAEIARQPGPQLVFVRSGPWRSSVEWIQNSADIHASKIIWAHDLGVDANRTLLDYYRGRTAWLLEPDAIPPRFRPYPAPPPSPSSPSQSNSPFQNVP